MKLGWDPKKWLQKKAKRGVRGYPVGTVAFYGPDDRSASEVAAGVLQAPNSETVVRRWIADAGDIRADEQVMAEVATFFREHGVRSVGMMDRIIGCPHEEAGLSHVPGCGRIHAFPRPSAFRGARGGRWRVAPDGGSSCSYPPTARNNGRRPPSGPSGHLPPQTGEGKERYMR